MVELVLIYSCSDAGTKFLVVGCTPFIKESYGDSVLLTQNNLMDQMMKGLHSYNGWRDIVVMKRPITDL